MNRMILLLAVLLVGVTVGVHAETDYASLPGYVDLQDLGLSDDVASSADVFLKKPLLKLVGAAIKVSSDERDERELADILSRLSLVQVRVFEDVEEGIPQIAKAMPSLHNRFEKQGWELIGRVRDRDEHVHVFYKIKDDKIEGLVITVVEDDGEAALVNVVGHFKPEDLGKLGRKIDLGLRKDFDWSKMEKVNHKS